MKHLNGNVCFALNATQKYSKNEMLLYLIKIFSTKIGMFKNSDANHVITKICGCVEHRPNNLL